MTDTERSNERNDTRSPADAAAAGEGPDTRAEVDPDVAQLLGLRPVDPEDTATEGELDQMGTMTDTRVYEGDLEARPLNSDQPDESDADNLESLLADELRAGETDDPNEAAEEGFAWVPPMDPPTRAGDAGEPEFAAGFGMTASDEPFDADHHSELLEPVDEVEARVLDALRANAETTDLVDGLEIDAEAGIIRIAGTVPELDDEDAVIAAVEEVSGVAEVISRIRVAAVDAIESEPPA